MKKDDKHSSAISGGCGVGCGVMLIIAMAAPAGASIGGWAITIGLLAGIVAGIALYQRFNSLEQKSSSYSRPHELRPSPQSVKSTRFIVAIIVGSIIFLSGFSCIYSSSFVHPERYHYVRKYGNDHKVIDEKEVTREMTMPFAFLWWVVGGGLMIWGSVKIRKNKQPTGAD